MYQLAITGTVVVWLSLLAGLFGRFHWLFDLFAHFRVQYALLFVVLAVLLITLRRFAAALFATVGLAVSAVPLFPYLINETSATAAAANGEPDFRLLSLNVWYRNPDMARAAAYIEQSQADAVVLLELTAAQAETLRPLLPTYPHYYVEPSRMGAAVFTKWPVLSSAAIPLATTGAIAVHMQIDWQGSPVNVLGVHLNWPMGPRNSAFRNEELNALVAYSKAQSGPLIVAGDFNLTPWSEYFRSALAASGLRDASLGFGLARSWPAQFAPVGMRIDHCLLSPHWRSVSTQIGPALGSDHLPLLADLRLQSPAR